MHNQHIRMLQFSQRFGKFCAQQFTPLLERTGLTMREVHVLLFLADNSEYDTARDITALRGMSKSQVSQAVDLLAAEGLLSRRTDIMDRRVVHLAVTPEGMPLAKECQTIQEHCERQLLTGLTEEQAAQFCCLLDAVLDNGIHLAEVKEAPL